MVNCNCGFKVSVTFCQLETIDGLQRAEMERGAREMILIYPS